MAQGMILDEEWLFKPAQKQGLQLMQPSGKIALQSTSSRVTSTNSDGVSSI